ncbi:MAG: putative cupin superfamily protein [Candidatus Paceibacteria bacterium]|jgi:uncharacterized cupin superfamily protein
MSDSPVTQATITKTPNGSKPEGEGWYVINAREAEWKVSPHFGAFLNFEGDKRFEQLGVNVHVLEPGQPACKYHSEALQEAFLVLSGECLLIVNGEQRPMGAWDFFHCPPGVEHVFVGAGSGPCVILMMGNRVGDEGLNYPKNEVAAVHGASVAVSTPDPQVAYEGLRDMKACASPLPLD